MKYTAMVKCKNCHANNLIQAEKGITVRAHCLDEERKCEYCNCLLFKEKEEKE